MSKVRYYIDYPSDARRIFTTEVVGSIPSLNKHACDDHLCLGGSIYVYVCNFYLSDIRYKSA